MKISAITKQLLLTISLTVFSLSAHAQMMTQTNNYDVFASSSPGFGGFYYSSDFLNRSFDKWNASQPLTSVTIEITGRNTGAFFVASSTPETVMSAMAQQNFAFVGGAAPDSIYDSSPYNLVTVPGPLPQPSTVGLLNLEDGSNLWQINGVYTYTDPSALAFFSGFGTFDLRLANLLMVQSTGGTIIGQGLISTGQVSVTMVPEPGVTALLGLAVLGLALRAVRRRSARA